MPRTLLFRSLHRCQCLPTTSSRTLPLRSPPRLRNPQQAYSTHPQAPHSSPRHNVPSNLAIYCIASSFLATIAYQSFRQPLTNDAPPNNNLSTPLAKTAPIEILPSSAVSDEEDNKIPTGTATIPYFPHKIHLPRSSSASDGGSPALPAGLGATASQDEEYELLGLGIRTVSFLHIQVYVVGIYVASSDLGKLQAGMVRALATTPSSATTLVEGEKKELRRTLLDAAGSERVWNAVLRDESIKSAVRIVPTRGTAFGHLRDGWLRGITARGKSERWDGEEGFREAVGEFRGIFGGAGAKGLEKGKGLLLGRGERGELRVWMEREHDAAAGGTGANAKAKSSGSKSGTMASLGEVKDERISRLVWLGYLAGGTVASDGARRSVVDGVMGLVERPIGTVETRVG